MTEEVFRLQMNVISTCDVFGKLIDLLAGDWIIKVWCWFALVVFLEQVLDEELLKLIAGGKEDKDLGDQVESIGETTDVADEVEEVIDLPRVINSI